jgi:ParB family chromosome partitioning protein
MNVHHLNTAPIVLDKPQHFGPWCPRGCLRLDPKLVVPSQWMERIEVSVDSPESQELRSAIERSGGNLEPITVRPLVEGSLYELISGHRRWRACQELGLDVVALVVDASDQDAARAMIHANSFHTALRPYEKGRAYEKLLAGKVYDTQVQLCEHLGLPASDVSNGRSLYLLPQKLLEVFRSPLDLRYKDAAPLKKAWKEDSGRVKGLAFALQKHSRAPFSHDDTVKFLVGDLILEDEIAKTAPLKIEIAENGKLLCVIKRSSTGMTTVAVTAPLSIDSFQKLEDGMRALVLEAMENERASISAVVSMSDVGAEAGQ